MFSKPNVRKLSDTMTTTALPAEAEHQKRLKKDDSKANLDKAEALTKMRRADVEKDRNAYYEKEEHTKESLQGYLDSLNELRKELSKLIQLRQKEPNELAKLQEEMADTIVDLYRIHRKHEDYFGAKQHVVNLKEARNNYYHAFETIKKLVGDNKLHTLRLAMSYLYALEKLTKRSTEANEQQRYKKIMRDFIKNEKLIFYILTDYSIKLISSTATDADKQADVQADDMQASLRKHIEFCKSADEATKPKVNVLDFIMSSMDKPQSNASASTGLSKPEKPTSHTPTGFLYQSPLIPSAVIKPENPTGHTPTRFGRG